jgi:hypothetical protein
VVLESKMFSKLSAGVTNAPYYDQAARTVACMAELSRRVGSEPGQMEALAFLVVAPRGQDRVLRSAAAARRRISSEALRRSGLVG